MSESPIPQAIWEGSFEISGVTLRCYVLDNGQRIINAEDLERLFESGPVIDHDEIIEFVKWSNGQ